MFLLSCGKNKSTVISFFFSSSAMGTRNLVTYLCPFNTKRAFHD